MESGINVAYKIIRVSKDSASHIPELTPLKLQKLLFYIQGWFAANNDKRFIQEDFEAWQYGPVIPVVYRHFSSQGSNDLSDTTIPSDTDDQHMAEIKKVLDVYGAMSPYELVARTHQEEVWIKNYNSPNPLMPFNEIKQAFRRKLIEL